MKKVRCDFGGIPDACGNCGHEVPHEAESVGKGGVLCTAGGDCPWGYHEVKCVEVDDAVQA